MTCESHYKTWTRQVTLTNAILPQNSTRLQIQASGGSSSFLAPPILQELPSTWSDWGWQRPDGHRSRPSSCQLASWLSDGSSAERSANCLQKKETSSKLFTRTCQTLNTLCTKDEHPLGLGVGDQPHGPRDNRVNSLYSKIPPIQTPAWILVLRELVL